MPDIGIPELLIILVIVLILFGPERLSGAAATLGQTIRDFRRGLQGEAKEEPTSEESDQQQSA
jgi:sec-independent protein translocase protein TatA